MESLPWIKRFLGSEQRCTTAIWFSKWGKCFRYDFLRLRFIAETRDSSKLEKKNVCCHWMVFAFVCHRISILFCAAQALNCLHVCMPFANVVCRREFESWPSVIKQKRVVFAILSNHINSIWFTRASMMSTLNSQICLRHAIFRKRFLAISQFLCAKPDCHRCATQLFVGASRYSNSSAFHNLSLIERLFMFPPRRIIQFDGK